MTSFQPSVGYPEHGFAKSWTQVAAMILCVVCMASSLPLFGASLLHFPASTLCYFESPLGIKQQNWIQTGRDGSGEMIMNDKGEEELEPKERAFQRWGPDTYQ